MRPIQTVLLCCAAALPLPCLAQDDRARLDSALAQQLRSRQTPTVAVVSGSRPLGEGRFVAVAVRVGDGARVPTAVLGCVSAADTSSARFDCVALPAPGIDDSEYAAQVEERREGDLDGDGEPEALIALTYRTPERCVVGADYFTRLFVLDVVPTVRLAAAVETESNPGGSFAPHLDGEANLTDVNGDGHADIVVEGQRCDADPSLEEAVCRRYVRRLLWSARTDAWRAPASAARR